MFCNQAKTKMGVVSSQLNLTSVDEPIVEFSTPDGIVCATSYSELLSRIERSNQLSSQYPTLTVDQNMFLQFSICHNIPMVFVPFLWNWWHSVTVIAHFLPVGEGVTTSDDFVLVPMPFLPSRSLSLSEFQKLHTILLNLEQNRKYVKCPSH